MQKMITKLSLLNKGNQNLIAKKLKNEIGFGKKILEVGSGTAQLSQYFALGTNNDVTALDTTYASLKLGREFSFKNKIPNINFVNGDIFDEIFEENIFDLVWCSGVLHHTKNPKKGFKQITKYLKRDGYIVIGLYNLYGRLFTKLRQVIYKFLPKIF
jgi:2-polyprenyl-3-methyl-5-hydroxy-6-metoxy-1,4-benzoquinol methylase